MRRVDSSSGAGMAAQPSVAAGPRQQEDEEGGELQPSINHFIAEPEGEGDGAEEQGHGQDQDPELTHESDFVGSHEEGDNHD